MSKENLAALIKKLPKTPGVYKFKDKEGRILYVGKAKNLKNRVNSYFRKNQGHGMRTRKLVEQVKDMEWIEVGSDLEALVLESNLIKELRPKYNVLLKDDKNFVYIKITREDFPRILVVRKVEKDGARYFGPKTAAGQVRKTLVLLQKLFMYRSCDLGLKWEGDAIRITKKTMAFPCLDYHIKRCAAPCISAITPEQYAESIRKIEYFLEGKTDSIEAELKEQMQACVERKEFERAAQIRDKVLSIHQLMEKQVVSSPDHSNLDVFAFVLDSGKAYFNLFMVRDGKLINQENFVVDSAGFERGEEDQAAELLESVLQQYYERATDIPSHILIPTPLSEEEFLSDWLGNQRGSAVSIACPQRGDKTRVLELAQHNAESFCKQHKARWMESSVDEQEALEELGRALGLPEAPKRLECFDISHLGGTDTVASMVVFEKGVAKSADYRKFRLKTIAEGEIDDFKSMNEILLRRLAYLKAMPAWMSVFKLSKKRAKDVPDLEAGALAYLAYEGEKLVGVLRYVLGKEGRVFLREPWVDPASMSPSEVRDSLLAYVLRHLDAERFYLATTQEEVEDFEAIRVGHQDNPFTDLPHLLAHDPKKHQDSSFMSKPQLLVIDGGKGQLSAAHKVLQHYGLNIPMIGLAKREEEIFFPEKSLPLLLPRDSKALYLLQRLRDEAHRFAITFQKASRKKHLTSSSLDAIPGVGSAVKMKLLKAFGSVEQIRRAKEESLAAVVGEKLAKRLKGEL